MKNIFLGVYIAGLTAISFWVLSLAVYEEPYITFNSREALIQLGTGMALLVLWIQLALVLVISVAKRWIQPLWLFTLIFIAVAVFYLRYCPFGYIYDLSNYHKFTSDIDQQAD